MSIINNFSRLIQPIKKRIHNLIIKGIVQGVNSSGTVQVVKVKTAQDELVNIERINPYGFYALPSDGAQAIVANINGDRSQGIVLMIGDSRYELTGLSNGDVAVANDSGAKIILSGNNIEITCPATGQVNINNGNLTVDV